MSTKTKSEACYCPICEDEILEATAKKHGDDAVECEGSCTAWIHRGCAGLSKAAFKLVCESDKPFFCPNCRLDKQTLELSSLREMVTSLTCDLEALKKLIQPLGTPSEKPISYASAVNGPSPSQLSQSRSPVPTLKDLFPSSNPDTERKFNLIISGIEESQQGVDRHTRQSHDLEEVSATLSSLVSSISSDSIKDLFRLGKFDVNHKRPRYILVKMIRASDVPAVLSKKSSLAHPIFIRRDLPREVRSRHSTLMKERRLLIESGIDRSVIKVQKHSITVKDVLYGELDLNNNSKFQKSTETKTSPNETPNETRSENSLSSIPLLPTLPTLPTQSTSSTNDTSVNVIPSPTGDGNNSPSS